MKSTHIGKHFGAIIAPVSSGKSHFARLNNDQYLDKGLRAHPLIDLDSHPSLCCLHAALRDEFGPEWQHSEAATRLKNDLLVQSFARLQPSFDETQTIVLTSELLIADMALSGYRVFMIPRVSDHVQNMVFRSKVPKNNKPVMLDEELITHRSLYYKYAFERNIPIFHTFSGCLATIQYTEGGSNYYPDFSLISG
jgi:hypothetical protein